MQGHNGFNQIYKVSRAMPFNAATVTAIEKITAVFLPHVIVLAINQP